MKIKVNKNQFLGDLELEYVRRCNRSGQSLTTLYPNMYNFETEDVTPEQLLEYIDKGYGIKINCE